MTHTRMGLDFKLKNDWKMLFVKDSWFMWRDCFERDGFVLKRLTILNVIKWYVVQFNIWLLIKIFKPLFIIADHYYWEIEGKETILISRMKLFEAIKPIKFFRLDK